MYRTILRWNIFFPLDPVSINHVESGCRLNVLNENNKLVWSDDILHVYQNILFI